jgi:hypothetical protein
MFPGDHEPYNNLDSPYPGGFIKISADDRRTAWLEVFKGSNMPGDLTVTWVEPGAILAWHRHEHQDDWMLVVEGTLKVGLWRGQHMSSAGALRCAAMHLALVEDTLKCLASFVEAGKLSGLFDANKRVLEK